MNLIAISASGYHKHPKACERLLFRLACVDRDDTILLDFDTIEREVDNSGSHSPVKLAQINFADWTKPGVNEDGVADPHAIRTAATSIPSAHAIVIDARGYRIDLVAAALDNARAAWYPLESWHPVFAVICDDMHQLYVLDKLSDTFFCQPQILTDAEVAAIVKRMRRTGMMFRWFGVGLGRGHKKLTGFLLNFVRKKGHRWASRKLQD